MRFAAVIATIGIALCVFDSEPSLAASGQFGEHLSATDLQLYKRRLPPRIEPIGPGSGGPMAEWSPLRGFGSVVV